MIYEGLFMVLSIIIGIVVFVYCSLVLDEVFMININQCSNLLVVYCFLVIQEFYFFQYFWCL